ncbi:MAG: DUF2937 family protein, partial [Microvirga sp.]
AGPFARLGLLLREGDTDLARAAYRDFEPAVPTTQEGFVTAVLGFLLGYALSRLVGVPLRRAFIRRPRMRAA